MPVSGRVGGYAILVTMYSVYYTAEALHTCIHNGNLIVIYAPHDCVNFSPLKAIFNATHYRFETLKYFKSSSKVLDGKFLKFSILIKIKTG